MKKQLFTLAWPAILEGIFQTVLQYVDTAMVGRLGAEATATVSLSSTYNWLIHSVISAFGVAFLSYIARAIGEKNQEKIHSAANQVVFITVVVGAVFTVVTLWMAPFMPGWMGADEAIRQDASRYYAYVNMPMLFRAATIIFGAAIRATGDTKTPMRVNVFVNFLNIGLNYIFIYMLCKGAVGAGMATGISVAVGGVMMTWAFARNSILHGEGYRFSIQCFQPNHKVLSGIMAIGLPIVMTRVASCMGHVVFTSFVSSMATSIYAAHAIAITAEEIFYIPGYGRQSATSTLIGNAIGEGDIKKQKEIKTISVVSIFVLMCITGLLLYFGAEFMMRIFTKNEQVIAIGTKLLLMVAFTEPVFGTSAVMEGIYNGMGRTKYPLFVELVSMWGVRIVGAFVCVRVLGLGITSVWVMMILNNVLKAILLAIGIFYISKKQGIKNTENVPI